MATIDDLEKVMLTEIELAEALLGILSEQREAIVCVEPDALIEAIGRGEELVQPLEALERERIRISGELWSSIGDPGIDGTGVNVSALTSRLPDGDAARIGGLGGRLRRTIEHILQVNTENKPLIDNALKFVRENMRIIRENFPVPLVDHKM
jgi:flagellar biosynthesis/type III secretory pathway chaperone